MEDLDLRPFLDDGCAIRGFAFQYDVIPPCSGKCFVRREDSRNEFSCRNLTLTPDHRCQPGSLKVPVIAIRT
jgi:hypothetical protein